MELVKRNGEREELNISKLRKVIQFACEDYPTCDPMELEMDTQIQFSDGMTTKEIQQTIIRAAVEKTKIDNPDWQFVASRLLMYDLYKESANNRGYENFGYGNFEQLIHMLSQQNLYGEYILEHYTKGQIDELEKYINPNRDTLFTYGGLRLLSKRYIVRDYNKNVMELPQERFMMIAMHLAMKEHLKVSWAKKFYDVLSQLKATVATPTLANAGKPHHQLSSCFIDTVGDNLEGIMDTAKSAAKVSKYGGGVGIYVGKIRGRASNIRTHKGVAAGVIPFTKIYNQVALAFDQVGQRAGAFAIYNDIWHSDILDFLDMKTNNGDERMKAHDIFPGVCIPDIFMEALEAREDWYLFDPHEIKQKMGFLLEDAYDDDHNKEFSRRYWACVANKDLHRVVVPAIEIMKKIMKSSFETGTPFIFYRDTVNKANPNKHAGMIYSSNLCVEIMQNMSAQEFISETITSEEGETFIVTKVKPGDFVVCNLSSLNLGNVESPEDIDNTVSILMRMMDNVIDLNFYPVPNAEVTNKKYRAVGLGTSGYHQYLALNGVMWESEQHLAVADELYEHIAYCAIKASNLIAMEKGSYSLFKGSEWHTGIYFARRGYITIDEEGIYHPVKGKERWYHLAISVRTHGMRNAWVFAVAPTGSTSIIAGSTASIDPIFSKYFMEEKKDGIVPEIAPQLSPKTIWYYKEAHQIDQQWSIKAAGKRQLHIDQSQSFNLYITPDTSAKELLNMYTESWKYGLKTIYYVRNKSLDATDCVVCT